MNGAESSGPKAHNVDEQGQVDEKAKVDIALENFITDQLTGTTFEVSTVATATVSPHQLPVQLGPVCSYSKDVKVFTHS